MPRYVVYAAEQTHQGEHGVYDVFITSVSNKSEAIVEGVNASLELMHSYSSIEEELQERAKELYPEDMNDPAYYQFIIDEVYKDNVLVNIHRLAPALTANIPTWQLEEKLAEVGYSDFVNLYCYHQ